MSREQLVSSRQPVMVTVWMSSSVDTARRRVEVMDDNVVIADTGCDTCQHDNVVRLAEPIADPHAHQYDSAQDADARDDSAVQRGPAGACSSARPSARASAPPSSSATRASCAPPTRWAAAATPPSRRAALAGNGGNGESGPRRPRRRGGPPADRRARRGGDAPARPARYRRRGAGPRAPRGTARHRAARLAPDPGFDRHVRLAAEVLNAPVALVSLVDEDRQFLKSSIGVEEPWASERETPLSHSFCQHTVAQGEPLVVDDAREHPVLKANPAVGGDGDGRLRRRPADRRRRPRARHAVRARQPPAPVVLPPGRAAHDLAASVVSEITLARPA